MKSLDWLFVLLIGVFVCAPARAQSEFIGEHFPYDAFDGLPTTPIEVGGGMLNVAFAPGEIALPRSALMDWLTTSAKAVSVYFGKFPVASARVLIVPVPGSGVQAGTTFGYRGAAIRLIVGSDVTKAELVDDWKAVHEMTHLALPDVEDSSSLAGGRDCRLCRAGRPRAGRRSDRGEDLGRYGARYAQGLPQAGDRGLDRTPTWGRTYWGGAMFCLLADVEIRKETNNAKGLQQALRGILDAGGDHEKDWNDWPIKRIFSVGDKATGTDCPRRSLQEDAREPYAPDLDALWRELGVSVQEGKVVFDDSAPLASIRRAITAPASKT